MNKVKAGLLTFGALASVSLIAASPDMTANAAFANDVSEQDRSVGSFSKINLRGPMDVHLTQASSRSVRVVADSKVIGDIETEVRGGTLVIQMDEDFNWKKARRIGRMNVFVSGPEFESIKVQGSGDVDIESLKQDDLTLGVQGSGEIVIDKAELGELVVRIQGSGLAQVEGTCKDIDVRVAGSGDLSADDLRCENADVLVQGSGGADIYASEQLIATVQGSGSVSVSGSPAKVQTSDRGSGKITIR